MARVNRDVSSSFADTGDPKLVTSLSWIRPCLIVGALVSFGAAVMILFPFTVNDRAIALRGSADMAYLDAQNLDLLVVLSEDEAQFRPKLPGEAGLYEFATARHMAKLGTLRFASDYYLWIMLNGRGPLETAIREEWRIAREMP